MTKREEGLKLIQMAGYLKNSAKVNEYCLKYRISSDVAVKHYIKGIKQFHKEINRKI
jgi:hypothetical protein